MTRTGFVHQALCYGSDQEFFTGTADFLRDGLDAGDVVLAVLSGHHIALLTEELGSKARDVEFADSRDWYDYPSRTLGRYHAYCRRQDTGRRVRVVGEPVWTGRTEFETREWMRYESLVNVAFAASDHWLLCPYDTRTLTASVLATARRTHPELALGARSSEPSGDYADPADFSAQVTAERSPDPLPAGPDDIRFCRGRSAAVRRALAGYARRHGMSAQRTYDMVAAVHEAVVNAVRYGGGQGVVRLRSDPEHLVCEIRDAGAHASVPRPGFPGHLPPDARAASGHGLWLIRQLSDLVAEDLDPAGSVLRLYFRRSGAVQPAAGSVNS
ncbi:sensor histidine kinase [Streptomyces sp. GESEQ-4]|uniref:sensor histidine kinase n=1 Tax=Streptomyces sp. GESEQ-4 TaxID=2812655 RepID=UPI001B338759|nr:sensor histidine kinase [Streptomyces sp. GESEQ-4]